MSDDQIKVNSIILQRGHFKLGPLSFEIQLGGLLALIGENGSGKTSLLRCLNGRLKPLSGEIVIGKRLKKVCAVGVEPIFFDHWSVKENFEWLACLGKLDWRKPELLQHIHSFYDQRVFELSSGKKRQAELVFALGHDFDVLLLDEAFAHLDPTQKSFFEREIGQFVSDNKMAILSGHDQKEFNGMPVSNDLRLS